MSLHRVFADEEPVGNLPITQPGGNEPENLQLARSDAELAYARLIDNERTRGQRRYFPDDRFCDDCLLDDDRRLLSGEGLSEPDAESGKQDGDQRAVNLHRMLDDQEAVLG